MSMNLDRQLITCYACGAPLFWIRCGTTGEPYREMICSEKFTQDEIHNIFVCNRCCRDDEIIDVVEEIAAM